MSAIAREKAGRRPDDDVFIVTKQTLQATIRQTQEGRVYYPSRRAGYVLDDTTERNLARALTAYFFVLVGSCSIFGPIGSETNHRALAMVLGLGAVLAFRWMAIACVLRNSPRSVVPFSRENAVQRAAATYGAERMWLMVFIAVLLVPASVYTVRNERPWDQAAYVGGCVAAAIYMCVFAARVLRAKAAMARAATAADRA